MPIVSPVAEETASADVKPIYESMNKKFGRMPNFFGMMAHKPEVLKNFLPFYSAITGPGALEQRYKELAYLKASITNGCEYCSKAHSASAKRIGITEEQIREEIGRMGRKLAQDYAGKDLLLIGVLKGAIMFIVDLARAIDLLKGLAVVQQSRSI